MITLTLMASYIMRAVDIADNIDGAMYHASTRDLTTLCNSTAITRLRWWQGRWTRFRNGKQINSTYLTSCFFGGSVYNDWSRSAQGPGVRICSNMSDWLRLS